MNIFNEQRTINVKKKHYAFRQEKPSCPSKCHCSTSQINGFQKKNMIVQNHNFNKNRINNYQNYYLSINCCFTCGHVKFWIGFIS